MKIWYQSYVDAEHGQSYWNFLGKHLKHITDAGTTVAVSYTHLRAHETRHDLVCRLLLEKKK